MLATSTPNTTVVDRSVNSKRFAQIRLNAKMCSSATPLRLQINSVIIFDFQKLRWVGAKPPVITNLE